MHRRPVALAPALALIAGLLTAVGAASPSAADSVQTTLRQRGTIVKVVDGDTVDVRLRSGKEKRVRLVGIDTPEVYNGTECGGPEASRSLKRLLPVGTRVRLVSDPTQDRVDRYGRILRYVIKVSNGKDMDGSRSSVAGRGSTSTTTTRSNEWPTTARRSATLAHTTEVSGAPADFSSQQSRRE